MPCWVALAAAQALAATPQAQIPWRPPTCHAGLELKPAAGEVLVDDSAAAVATAAAAVVLEE